MIGSLSEDGQLRDGIDVERVLSIDNHALRIQPLLQPGWGRAGISYGPYERRPGLAYAALILNGHNTAQSENLTESFLSRFDRWLAGPEVHRRRTRLLLWIFRGRWARTIRQWRWWFRIAKGRPPVPRIDENLALGWFSQSIPLNPLADGQTFVMHATGAENGELWISVGAKALRAIRGVQNIPVLYVVALRERGAVYYAASVAGARGLGPRLRPLAVDPFGEARILHAGLFQSTLGQVGFRLDTRVRSVCSAIVEPWSAWYGSAHAAEKLVYKTVLVGSTADVGGVWRSANRDTEQVNEGTGGAVLFPPSTSGLIHVLLDGKIKDIEDVGILWRFDDHRNFWKLNFSSTAARLSICRGGIWTHVASDSLATYDPTKPQSIQVLDDGYRFSVHHNGQLLFSKQIEDGRLGDARGVGIATQVHFGAHFREFEAHPRGCALPEQLDPGPIWSRTGHLVAVADDFVGPAGPLEGRATQTGGKVWQRSIGAGHIDVTGQRSARVRASSDKPNPGRLAYTVEWDDPHFAELEVTVTPPGTTRGKGDAGRAGFVFWQDPFHYIALNIWLSDDYGGASISTFFQLGRFEDLYDAVWTNVGDRVSWGRPCRLRMAFDGMQYMVHVDDEPVLYRALTDVYPDATRIALRRVGLLANWEWGNDTGSTFRNFVGRTSEEQ